MPQRLNVSKFCARAELKPALPTTCKPPATCVRPVFSSAVAPVRTTAAPAARALPALDIHRRAAFLDGAGDFG